MIGHLNRGVFSFTVMNLTIICRVGSILFYDLPRSTICFNKSLGRLSTIHVGIRDSRVF